MDAPNYTRHRRDAAFFSLRFHTGGLVTEDMVTGRGHNIVELSQGGVTHHDTLA